MQTIVSVSFESSIGLTFNVNSELLNCIGIPVLFRGSYIAGKTGNIKTIINNCLNLNSTNCINNIEISACTTPTEIFYMGNDKDTIWQNIKKIPMATGQISFFYSPGNQPKITVPIQ